MISTIDLSVYEEMQDNFSEFESPRIPTLRKMKFEDAQQRHRKAEKPRKERVRWEESVED
jgi:hypothetical protein